MSKELYKTKDFNTAVVLLVKGYTLAGTEIIDDYHSIFLFDGDKDQIQNDLDEVFGKKNDIMDTLHATKQLKTIIYQSRK